MSSPSEGRESPTVDASSVSDPDAGPSRRTARGRSASAVHAIARSNTVRTTAEAGGVAVVALAIASMLYRVWNAQMSIALVGPSGDTNAGAAAIKGATLHGWFLTNPDLGAPFRQQQFDFPQAGEVMQLTVVRFLSLFSNRPYLVMNVYYLLGFGMLAAVTYAVLRQFRLHRLVSAAVALLYTFLPYHFFHEEAHLYRSAYISAPTGALLILWILTWRTSFLSDPQGAARPAKRLFANLRWGRVAAAIGLAATVALIDTITIAFVLVTLACGVVLVAIRDRDLSVVVAGAAGIVAVGVVFALAMSPNLWYWHQHGSNKVAGRRTVAEQEFYGLRVSQMVLPTANHRLHDFAKLHERGNVRAATDNPVNASPLRFDEGGQALGLLGAIGLLSAIYGGFRYAMRGSSGDVVEDRQLLRGYSGMLAMVLILFATVSGLALVLSIIGFTQIRTWNRAVVLIAFFSYLTLAIGLESMLRWIRSRRIGRTAAEIAAAALLVLVTAFGLWDTAVPTGVPQSRAALQQAAVLKDFTAGIEQVLPKGSSVFQLPAMPFPESDPIANMRPYDPVLMYVYADGLRWSYGAMKGRPEGDWQDKVDKDDPGPSLSGLRGLGFDGLELDTFGYTDRGVKVIAQLDALLGKPVVTSEDGRYVFWDLRPYADRQGLTTAELRAAAGDLVGAKLLRTLPVTPGATKS